MKKTWISLLALVLAAGLSAACKKSEMSQAGDTAGEAAKDAGQAVGEAAKDAGEAVGDAAKDTADAAKKALTPKP